MVLLVISDPASSWLEGISRVPRDVSVIVSNDLEELKRAAPQADVILLFSWDDQIETIFPLAHRAKWIHCFWTGVDLILTPAIRNHPAPLTNGRGVFRWPLADWIIGAMLFFAFDFRRLIRQQQERLWQPFAGRTLNGQTLGIVGYGSIGSAAASRARPFGMKVAALRRRPELFEGDSLVDRNYGVAELKQLIAASDYVLAAAPLTSETQGLIGEPEIEAMKPSAVLINVGRGPVVDEAALIRALESGRIRGAALDVFVAEPLPPGHPFWRMPNVLLSPHTADRVEGFLEPAWDCFLDNLARFRHNRPLMNVVDKRAGY